MAGSRNVPSSGMSGLDRTLDPARRRLPVDIERYGKAIFAALLALLVTGSAIYLAIDHRAYWRESVRQLEATNDVIVEFVQQVFAIVDLTLHSIDDDPATPNIIVSRPPLELHEIMRRAQSLSPVLQGLGITDTSGRVFASATSPRPTSADLSDRDYFIAHRDSDDAGLYVGHPVIARPQNVMALPVSRRAISPDGRFIGVIAARLDPDYFTQLFSVSGADVVTVARLDGVVVARHPEIDLANAAPIARSNVIRLAQSEARGVVTVVSAVDGIERVSSFRVLKEPRLVVIAAMETANINYAWLARTYPFLALLAGGLGFLVVVALLLQRHERSMNAALAATADARAAAEQAADAKGTFLANMSHEIRTPLGGILGYADLLLKSGLTRQQMDWAFKLKGAGEQLLAVINDILDFSKLEAGDFTVDPKAVALASLVDEVRSLMLTQAETRGLELTCAVEPNLPPWIRIDPVRLRQILMNLVSNAIKFTDRGKVSISVTRARLPDGRAALSFEVADTGIGIPEDRLAAVFQRFTQAETKDSRGRGGTGLGLSISRRLAELMDGTLTLDSRVGAGTTVRATLPLIVAKEPAAAEKAVPAAGRTGRILLVDDLPMNLEITGAMLRAQGHQVTTATTGTEAIDMALSGAFDAVLLDINLPDIDGYEVAREIRKLERLEKRTPILALTANALPEHIMEALSAGMDGHVAKPIDERMLAAQLAAVLSPGARVAGGPPPEEMMPLVDLRAADTLRRLIGKERFLGLEQMFWVAWREFRDDLLAGRMDDRALGTRAHDMVSHAGNVGYVRLAEACRALSYAVKEGKNAERAALVEKMLSAAEATRHDVERG